MLIVTSMNAFVDPSAIYRQYQSILQNPSKITELGALHHTYGMPANGQSYTQQEFGRLFGNQHVLHRFKSELDRLAGNIKGLYNELQKGTRPV